MPDLDFTWRDGDRTIRFGRGALDDAPGLLGDGYLLLTTERSALAAPALAAAAATRPARRAGPGRRPRRRPPARRSGRRTRSSRSAAAA